MQHTMPITTDTDIPIAQYGSSNIGRMKTSIEAACTIGTAVSCRSWLACTIISPCQTRSGNHSKKFAGAGNL